MKRLFYYKTFSELVCIFINKYNIKQEDIQCITSEHESDGYVYIYYWSEKDLDENKTNL